MSISDIEQKLQNSQETLGGAVPALSNTIGLVAASKELIVAQVQDKEESLIPLHYLHEAHRLLTDMLTSAPEYQSLHTYQRPASDEVATSTANPENPAAEKYYANDNEREIGKLLDDDEVTAEALGLQPGETVSIIGQDEFVSSTTFDRIVDKHMQLIGRTLAKDIQNPSPQGVLLYQWDYFNVGRVLRGKLLGKLANVSITRVALTEEELELYYPGTYAAGGLTHDTIAKLIICADLKSGGRAPVPIALEMVLAAYRPSKGGRDQIHKPRKHAVTKSREAIALLKERVAGTALKREAEAMRSPLSGGIPGKQRGRF